MVITATHRDSPYDAKLLVAEVREVVCVGCGACDAAGLGGGSGRHCIKTHQLMAMLESVLGG